ncbi:arabinosylfuranosidase ArfA [Lachnoclostridium sp. Marseille-P6806]|uniref:arabinosylfuranosidase ArfA n=1 Tax=Lachnoclostridium sp. Marseille-P6806 TaxID=2364793 RepID=UPI001F5EA2E0|nr:alpha-L-arabinofuranosidase C-terminal domain-containing protein [Lachnoclostridium sp. Marseille-P6806]
MMQSARIKVNRSFQKGEISPYIYGSFVEHMGRVVYSGIYEPDHPCSDEDGFRGDVLEKIKGMGVTCVRYPGGNFVSTYDWRDGVGPKENRPRKRTLAWKSIETNEFGTDEFMKWAGKAGVMPVFAVNLGTKGIENALSFLEYCNLPAGTFYSDMRAGNGHAAPYEIPVWCLGNEMDGDWQIGHKTAEEYGKLAAQTAHAMKALDADLQLVVCGSSSASMASYTDWERIVLEEAYDYVDYIALHQYFGGQEAGTAAFLAQAADFDRYIHTVEGICDTVRSKKRSRKQINISIDEWGVWEIRGTEVEKDVNSRDWEIAPAFSEQIYTMEDTLLFASMLMTMLRHCDRVKFACQSLLTNISACIMTEKGGGCWVQPIYYPFALMSEFGRGSVLECVEDIAGYDYHGMRIPYIDALCVHNTEKNELVFFILSRNGEDIPFEAELQDFHVTGIEDAVVLQAEDIKTTNAADHEVIAPRSMPERFSLDGHLSGKTLLRGTIEGYSWNMLRVRVEA